MDKQATLPQQIGNVSNIFVAAKVLDGHTKLLFIHHLFESSQIDYQYLFPIFLALPIFWVATQNMRHRHKNIEHKNKGNVTVISGDRPKILETLATMALALFWGFHCHMKRITLIIIKSCQNF